MKNITSKAMCLLLGRKETGGSVGTQQRFIQGRSA